MDVYSLLDMGLRASGAVGIASTMYCVGTFLKALSSHVDSVTRAAPKLTDEYKGKVIWITGASSGIGKELAFQLSRQGAKVPSNPFPPPYPKLSTTYTDTNVHTHTHTHARTR